MKELAEKPTAAFVLSLIGGIFVLIEGIIIAAAVSFIAGSFAVVGFLFAAGIAAAVGVVYLIFGVIMIYGAVMINSGEPGRVRTGSILVLIFAIISLVGLGGFFLGFLLGLIGAILGLTWKPSATATPPPAPPL